MNVAPFGDNFNDLGYRAIKTKQFTYVKTTAGPSNLYDNTDDPYQMNNLVNLEKVADVQMELDCKLLNALGEIGDEFGDRNYYLNKWNYTLDENRRAVDWWSFDEGNGVVQSPKPEAY